MFYIGSTLQQLSDRPGKPWRGIIRYRDSNGKIRQKTRVFRDARGKREAEAMLVAWRAECESAVGTPTPTSVPVESFCMEYVDGLGARQIIEPSTLRDYRHMLKYLWRGEAPIADVPLGELTPAQIDAWVNGLIADGLAPTTVKKALRVLGQCTRYALDTDELVRDPVAKVKSPKVRPATPNALDAEQRARLVAVLDGMDASPLKVSIALSLFAGLRQGEVCGLRWRNVDLNNGIVSVRESVGNGVGGSYLKRPKNDASIRDVPITRQLQSVLAERRARMVDECIAAGVPFLPDLFVAGMVDGRFQDATALSKAWKTLAEVHGFIGVTGQRIRFHDLRHSYATALITSGTDVKTVSSLLGHASARMTLDVYTSADPSAKRAATERLSEVFAQPPKVVEFRPAANDV